MFEHLADPAPDEGPALRAEYRLRQRRMYGLMAGWMLWCLLTVVVTTFWWPPAAWLWLAGAVVHLAIHRRTWSCPRCGAGLGRSLWVDVCPGCRLILEDEGDADEAPVRS